MTLLESSHAKGNPVTTRYRNKR